VQTVLRSNQKTLPTTWLAVPYERLTGRKTTPLWSGDRVTRPQVV
jgi:hypothetical protein